MVSGSIMSIHSRRVNAVMKRPTRPQMHADDPKETGRPMRFSADPARFSPLAGSSRLPPTVPHAAAGPTGGGRVIFVTNSGALPFTAVPLTVLVIPPDFQIPLIPPVRL